MNKILNVAAGCRAAIRAGMASTWGIATNLGLIMGVAQAGEPAKAVYPVPTIHYRPITGAFADTIPFYWKGRYHVFYLRARPGGIPWEHISSTDLLNWQEHPAALAPGPADSPDGESVFTGCIVEKEGRFHAFYTGWNPKRGTHREQIMHASSLDLLRWIKHPQDTFHADGTLYQDDGGKDFRDPCVVWDGERKQYVMFLYARQTSDGRGVMGRYASKDLAGWAPLAPLDGRLVGECPDSFQIQDRWYAIVSSGGTAWASSGRLGGRFPSPPVGLLDTPMLSGVRRMWDGRRHIAVGFIRDLNGNRDYGQLNWGGTMCLPREMYCGSSGELCVRPATEVVAAFSERSWTLVDKPHSTIRAGQWSADQAGLTGQGEQVSAVFKVPADYMLKLRAKTTPTGKLTLRFRDQGAPGGGYCLVVDRKHQTTELRAPLYSFERGTAIPSDQPLTILAFVQGTIIECFVNDAHAFTCRAYDYARGDLGIQADDGGLVIQEMEIRRQQK
jgi:beta-fructofuranosidase